MTRTNDTIDKYLSRHAEPEAAAVSLRALAGMRHVLTVPTYDEPAEALDLLDTLPAGSQALCIMLINERTDSPPAIARRSAALLEAVRERFGPGRPAGGTASEHPARFGGLLVLQRTSATQPLPAKQGVGLARKLTCDVALSLIRRAQLNTNVLHCTDADARLPPDYFQRVASEVGASPSAFAAVFPFEHVGAPQQLHGAGQVYERSLRYYVAGLQQAGSPYAMHTIGSTIAVSARAYAAVRGVPRRHGAEDFYLLNKLAKVGPVHRLRGAPIALWDRVSDRVPFGTGPAVARIIRGERPRLYHPASFARLRHLLTGLERLAVTDASPAGSQLATLLCPELPRTQAARLVEAFGIHKALQSARQRGPDERARLRHLHTHFDAFFTLKWIHALRDGGLAEQPAHHAAATLLGREPRALDDDVQDLKRYEDAHCRGPIGVDARPPSYGPPR